MDPLEVSAACKIMRKGGGDVGGEGMFSSFKYEPSPFLLANHFFLVKTNLYNIYILMLSFCI